mmetsp:Transcript_119021/g.381393  ORF Transcript_119021/g.381393 Transcript_119021/m.381393 type:complete len:124 (+) Transcript_119021:334-705(+)
MQQHGTALESVVARRVASRNRKPIELHALEFRGIRMCCEKHPSDREVLFAAARCWGRAFSYTPERLHSARDGGDCAWLFGRGALDVLQKSCKPTVRLCWRLCGFSEGPWHRPPKSCNPTTRSC